MSLREMVEEVLRLPEADRAALAATLIESLDRETQAVSSDAWDAEIRSRLDEWDRGQVTPIPWDDVRRQLREDASADAG
ncbi:MAG: addiction module protein [Planctomycetota bacterium]|nr:addiction module protein [Planctomycetaceae bacterium]MDQ3331410.1 addiction module protein [Planctomycetota bacterium]